MNRLIPLLLIAGVIGFIYSGATLVQVLIWTGSWLATLLLMGRFISQLYPGQPAPVSEGEIEDAVLVFTFSEAMALNSVYLIAWGATIVAALLVL